MGKFFKRVRDWLFVRKEYQRPPIGAMPRINDTNIATGFIGSDSYQRLLAAGDDLKAKETKLLKKVLPITLFVIGFITLVAIMMKDYSFLDGLVLWVAVMILLLIFIVLPLAIELTPTNNGVKKHEIEKVVADNTNALKAFYDKYVNDTLNNAVSDNDKVDIKPLNFKTSVSRSSRSEHAIKNNDVIKLIGMYSIESKFVLVTLSLNFNKNYTDLYVFRHDIELFAGGEMPA